MTSHTITIVGPGAIGCLFAAMLKEAGHEVILLDHNPVRAEKIARGGIHIEGVSGTRDVAVSATARALDLPDSRLVIIATKSYDTEKALMSVAPVIGPSTPVLTLQNGLGNVELISRYVGDDRTIGGITSQGATLVSDGFIIHAGTGKTVIGTPSNRLTDKLVFVKDILKSAGFEPEISEDLEATIWSKLIINIGINALTAVTRLNNGRLLEFEDTREVMREAVSEAVAVARARGVRLTNPAPLGQVEEVCRRTAANISSMLQDVLAGRKTEVDAINGAVAGIGKDLGVLTPVNSTLASVVRVIESSYHLQVRPRP
ncbi:MAG: 2-dehydropantoate 2-reductase [Candidatus Abyssubacteria bacterium]